MSEFNYLKIKLITLLPHLKISNLRYRTGGDGGNALKLLLTFVKNVVDHPDDVK